MLKNERLLKEAEEIANHLNFQGKGEFTSIDVYRNRELINETDWNNAKKEDFILRSVNKIIRILLGKSNA